MTAQLIMQIIGACGIVTSLGYAAIQIRRNTRAVRAGNYLQVTSGCANTWLSFAADAEMVDLILRGTDKFEELNRVEQARFRFALMGYLRQIENAFFLHRLDILKARDWRGILGDMEALISRPGAHVAWPMIKHCCGEEFGAYVQAIVDRHEATSSQD